MMIRVRLHAAFLAALAVNGLLAPAWLADARQAPDDRAGTKAPPAGKTAGPSAVDIGGNWIVWGGERFAVIRIEGPPGQRRARLLSVGNPDVFDLARSRLDHVRIDETTVRFTLQLFRVEAPPDLFAIEIVAHRFGDEARPTTLRGGWIRDRGRDRRLDLVTPVTLERTDRAELDPKEADPATPGWEEYRRVVRSNDPAALRESLEGILAKYDDDTPLAWSAAQALVMIRAEAGAPNEELRGLIDRAARVVSRHGREMEIGTIGTIVANLTGAEGRDDLVVEYARRAVAMLRPEDSAGLRIPTIRCLVNALRKSGAIDEAKAAAEVQALEDHIARLDGQAGRDPAPAGRNGAPAVPWAWSFAAANKKARADGKLVMVVFYTENSRWERLDTEVFPRPDVVEATRTFVPVKVDAEDAEGRPLAEKYRMNAGAILPMILFLDPANREADRGGVVARIPGMLPAGTIVEGMRTIARLPRDIGPLVRKAHPDDGDSMRLLATALATRGRLKDAAALVDRAWGPGADPGYDRWAAVYNAIGIELAMRLRWREAAEWFHKAAGVAKRPIDVYNAHLGAGFASMLQQKRGEAARELEAAARVGEGVSDGERAFAREWLGDLARGPGGSPEAAAALKRLDAKRTKTTAETPTR